MLKPTTFPFVLYRYQEARGRLMQCRHPSDVAKLDKQLAAEWSWLQEVRRNTATAVNLCTKQVGHLTWRHFDSSRLHASITFGIPHARAYAHGRSSMRIVAFATVFVA
jgi:hypothetical protein